MALAMRRPSHREWRSKLFKINKNEIKADDFKGNQTRLSTTPKNPIRIPTAVPSSKV
jgi:hypothetical protein